MAQSFDFKPAREIREVAHRAAHQAAAHPAERRWRVILFQAYLIAAVSIFAVLALAARTTAYFALDLTITRALQSLVSPAMSALMLFVSWFGYMPQSGLLPVIFALLIWFFGLRWEAVMLFATSAGVSLLNLAVKILIQRPRPTRDLIQVLQIATGFSFPSGHVMGYVALFGFLLFLSVILFRSSLWRTLLIIFCALMILLVGPSRVYLGDHWASDAFAAYLLGSLGLSAGIVIYRWGKGRFFRDQPAAPEPIDRGSSSPTVSGADKSER